MIRHLMTKRTVALVMVILTVGWLSASLAVWLSGMRYHRLPTAPADAALVLGCRVMIGGQSNACLSARVEQGARLYRAQKVRYLVVSGGQDREDDRSEARAMHDLARGMGVPESAIVLEPQATSTEENMRFSRPLLEARQAERVVVITQPFHLSRAMWLAKRELAGMAVEGYAASESCGSGRGAIARAYLREPLAWIQNSLRIAANS